MKYVHVGINVSHLEKSVEFYQKMFGVEPVKVKGDYAKFLLESPGLNFTLNVRDAVSGNQVNHFGFQVERAEEIAVHKERLEKEGLLVREELDTTCCYAVQDKFWITDPDGNEWEFFYTKADSDLSQANQDACCVKEHTAQDNNSCC
ncbi:ArsI/CadI family heavy metal resistance metalloenzyme [Brevibacillus gelatini]|uniref:ArsI/CadI family heavy metal resistance metalloenzyme n=1 Tax=Brevibacillus gelatini TaxID=1655277 RepID=UPI003D819ACF